METIKNFIEFLQDINQEQKNFTKEDSDIFIFCFLMIGFLEKAVQNAIYGSLLDSQSPKLRHPSLIDFLTKERTFLDKIKIFEFILKYAKEEGYGMGYENTKELLRFCIEINGIRNNLFHFKIDELHYKGRSLRDFKVQKEIFDDFKIKVRKTLENIQPTL